jgi:drug/metabolite transporter (DMT)-like permease
VLFAAGVHSFIELGFWGGVGAILGAAAGWAAGAVADRDPESERAVTWAWYVGILGGFAGIAMGVGPATETS